MTRKFGEVAYSESATKAERKAAVRAQNWAWSPTLEKLAELKENDPGEFARLSPSFKIRLGHYLDDKAAAAAAGIDTRPPGSGEDE